MINFRLDFNKTIEIHEISVGVNEVFKLCSQVIIREDTVSHTFF